MPKDFLQAAILLAMIIVSFTALFLGWSAKPMMAIDSAQYSLRRWVAGFGVLAISAQRFCSLRCGHH
jgi:hypothetical protein